MSVFISDIDTAKLCVQFFRPLAQCAVKLECCVVDLYEQDYEWSLSSRLQETRNKKKVQLDNPKSRRSQLREIL